MISSSGMRLQKFGQKRLGIGERNWIAAVVQTLKFAFTIVHVLHVLHALPSRIEHIVAWRDGF